MCPKNFMVIRSMTMLMLLLYFHAYEAKSLTAPNLEKEIKVIQSKDGNTKPWISILPRIRGGGTFQMAAEGKQMVVLMALSASAACVATVFSHPLDLTKVRLQLDGELAERGEERVYKGWIHCISSNWQSNGVAGLEQGLPFALMREAIVNCFRLGCYQPVLNLVHRVTHTEPSTLSVVAKFLVAAICGLIGGFFANPVDLLKVRMQTQKGKSFSTGHQHGYKNAWHAMASLVKEEGVGGLFKGFGTSGFRIAVGSGVQVPAYHGLKAFAAQQGFSKDSAVIHACCSLGSSALCVACINPMDVIRTRLFNQPFDSDGKGKWYKSGVDAAQKIARIEGPLAFYKGALIHYMRLGPHLMLTFVLSEQFQNVARYIGILEQ